MEGRMYDKDVFAVVMAAGKSTRMKSDLPKVLHELCGRPLLEYVLDALAEAGIRKVAIVVGFGADLVRRRIGDRPGQIYVEQKEQKGTGHAVAVCKEGLAGHKGPVVVLAGDGPFVRADMIRKMLDRFAETHAKAFLATAVIGNPTGYGRIVRDAQGDFDRIVEQKDANAFEAEIAEINPSFYVFDGGMLFGALAAVTTNNAQGEYYITDVPAILKKDGHVIVAERLADAVDIFGINHRRHLAEAHRMMQDRIQGKLMDAGVTIVDPPTSAIDARASIGRDSVIEPFTVIEGPCEIGERCRVPAFSRVLAGAKLAAGETFRG